MDVCCVTSQRTFPPPRTKEAKPREGRRVGGREGGEEGGVAATRGSTGSSSRRWVNSLWKKKELGKKAIQRFSIKIKFFRKVQRKVAAAVGRQGGTLTPTARGKTPFKATNSFETPFTKFHCSPEQHFFLVVSKVVHTVIAVAVGVQPFNEPTH